MKLRYFIPMLVAAVMTLISCSDKFEPTYLSEVQVSSSTIGLKPAGGEVTIEVNASDSWSISDVPSWLTVSPQNGGAGQTTVRFSVPATTESHEAVLKLTCGGKTQLINVFQTAEKTEPVILTVAQAVAKLKANQALEESAYVKGIVCKIQEISPQYGNATFFLSDDGTYSGSYGADGSGDGNWFEVYRGAWLNGAAFTKGDEFSVGDEMVVSGIIMSYKGTPETKEKTAQVVTFNKSLIKVDSLSTNEALPIEGGEVTAFLTCKGNGVNVEIPADAKNWLSIVAISGSNITFRAAQNTGGDRATTITFNTTDGSKEYTAQASISQKGAILKVNIAEFLAAPVGDTSYRIQGVVSKEYPSDKQGKSFYIKDFSGETLVYRTDGFLDSGIKVGDIVEVVGKRGAYNGNPQLVNGTCELLHAVTEVTIAEFLTKPDDKNTYYMVSGTISSFKAPSGNDYDFGNLFIKDGTNELYVYGCYPGWGATGDNRKFFLADNDIEVGDRLTIIGYKSTYNGVAQLANGVNFSFTKANAE